MAAGGFGAVQLSAGADGPSVTAVRAAALSRGLRPLVIAAADSEDADEADLVLLDARTPTRTAAPAAGSTGGRSRPRSCRAIAWCWPAA